MKKILLTILLCLFVCGCGLDMVMYKGKFYRSAEEADLQREVDLTQIFSHHPEWSEHHKNLIRRKTFCVGMSPEQVELSFASSSNLTFEWEGSRDYSYYSAYLLYDCPSGYSGRICTFRVSFCFYDGKLQSWSKSIRHRY